MNAENTPNAYLFDKDRIFYGIIKCSPDPLESNKMRKPVWLLPANATFTAPPAAEAGKVVVWNGTTWDMKENNRGTKYWLPGDTWSSEPREMKGLGPLPEGAVTVRPEKPLSVVKEEKEREVRSACDAAIIASLTMPAASPSVTEVSVAAASLAAVDPDGPDTILALHAARRDELLALIQAADSVAAVQAVEVTYAV